MYGMSGRLVSAGGGKYIVVVKGFGFVTKSDPVLKPEAVAILADLTFKGKERKG